MKSVEVSSKLAGGILGEQNNSRRSLKKIEIASACSVKVAADEDNKGDTCFSISSETSMEACDLAQKYLDYSLQASRGQKIVIDTEAHASDLLIHYVASSIYASIIGRNAGFISSLEDELHVLCFSGDEKEASVINQKKIPECVTPEGLGAMVVTDGEVLVKKQILSSVPIAILGGSVRARIAFKFKLMHMIESKSPGIYTQLINGVDLTETPQFHYTTSSVSVDTCPVAEAELSLANGRFGLNRKRIAHVSGCVVEYIGACAFFYGDVCQRQLARTLLTIILERGRGSFQVPRWKSAIGVLTVECGPEHVGWLTNKQGVGFHQVEESAPVLCFMEVIGSGQKPGVVSAETRLRELSSLPHPLARVSGSGSEFIVTLKSKSEQPRNAIVVLGSDENLRTALKFILTKIDPSEVEDVCSSTSVVSMFQKLFRTRGNKISVSDPVISGNKLHRTVIECIQQFPKENFYSLPCPLPELTVLEVPPNFPSSNLQALLRQLEDEYGVYCGVVLTCAAVIVGPLRPRRAAELKIMAAIESKFKGFFSHREVRDGIRACDKPWNVSTEDFDTDTFPIPQDELSFALGNKGSMRKKLAMASGCIIEYVGDVAFFSGTLVERSKGKDYLKWVLQQLDGEVAVPNYQQRTDIAFVPLNRRMAGYVNGNRGRLLRATEELTGTFCFVGRSNPGTSSNSSETKPLIICGMDEGRTAAFVALSKYLEDHQNSTWADEGGVSDSSNSIESLKTELFTIISRNGLKPKPLEPWKIGSNSSLSYVYISQPCPAASRKDANILPENKSAVLRSAGPRKDRSGLSPSQSEFVNDSTAFPELGGSKRSSFRSVTSPEPAEVPSPPPPPPPPAQEAWITIDKEKGEIWGDWGLGPDGDPTIVRKVVEAPKLMGAWK